MTACKQPMAGRPALANPPEPMGEAPRLPGERVDTRGTRRVQRENERTAAPRTRYGTNIEAQCAPMHLDQASTRFHALPASLVVPAIRSSPLSFAPLCSHPTLSTGSRPGDGQETMPQRGMMQPKRQRGNAAGLRISRRAIRAGARSSTMRHPVPRLCCFWCECLLHSFFLTVATLYETWDLHHYRCPSVINSYLQTFNQAPATRNVLGTYSTQT